MLARFTIAGWGTALPERRVTNQELSTHLDTSNEWIVARTGIHERRIAGEGESTGPLALQAARRALDAAGLRPTDLDMVIVSTSTPEQPIPSTASGLTATMGITAGAFDLNAACAGFVYGLVVAGGLVQTGAARTVMLVGSDTMSRFVDPADRSTAVLFGDGAGAIVLAADTGPGAEAGAAGAAPGGLLACDLVGDPEAFDLLVVPAGGAGRPPTIDTVRAGEHYLYMDGREVFRRAVRGVTDSIARTLDRAGCKPDEVDLFVPHQANSRIIDAVLDRVGIPADRAVQTVDRHGNTSSASVPLAIGEITETQQLRDGSLILTSGFGAGLTVGTGLLRWRASRRGPSV
ncbi:MAG: beta-ketoacyl-ACP synthase III [Acidimicrobiales bacterium]